MADDEYLLTGRIIALASEYGRYGYRRITALLRREGWRVNHKRVERLWRREGLKVPQKQPKRGRLWLNDGSCVRLRPIHKDHVWSYDFVHDRTHDGRAYRTLTVIDKALQWDPRNRFQSAVQMRFRSARLIPSQVDLGKEQLGQRLVGAVVKTVADGRGVFDA